MRRALYLLTLAAGCHSNVTIDLPPLDGARSMILWIFADDELAGVYAEDVTPEGALFPPLPAVAYGDDVELFAMTFPCPMQSVGLPLGPLELADFPNYDEPRTPPPSQMFASKLGEQGGAWREISEMDPRMLTSLLALELDEDHACSRFLTPFEITEIEVDRNRSEFTTFAVPVDDHRILLGSSNGRLFEVRDDGTWEQILDIGLPAAPVEMDFRGAHRQEDGTLWLYAYDGRVARGTLDGGFELLPQVSTATGSMISLTGSPNGAPLELFAVTDQRTFARFDGTTWETVYMGTNPPLCDLGFDKIAIPPVAAWVAPGEALALGAGERSGSLLRYRDGQAFEEPLPGITGYPSHVLQTERGTYAATCDGDLAVRVDERWEPAYPGRAETAFPIIAIEETATGLIYASPEGFRESSVAQFHPKIGYCIFDEVEGLPRTMVRAGSTVFLIMLRRENSPIRVLVMKEGDPPCFAQGG